MKYAAEIGLDAGQRGAVVGFETQHHHRRGIRWPRQTESVGVFDAQTVDADDLARAVEAGLAL